MTLYGLSNVSRRKACGEDIMSDKRFIYLIISLVLFGFSFISLISAMIIHAVLSDEVFAPAMAAIISFILAFIAVITIILFSKTKKGNPKGEK